MASRLFNFIELSYDNLTRQIDGWLKITYNKADILFSSASPFGQLLAVQKELFVHNILYLKNAVRQINIVDTESDKMIKSISRIAGHNPSRAISASGALQFKLKNGVDINTEIQGSSIVIKDGTQIKNKTNNLNYVITLGTDQNIYQISTRSEFILNVIQGKYEFQTYTGSGRENQSISVAISSNSRIDNFRFEIYYNGNPVIIRNSLYDMLQGEIACYTRTGFDGGLDLYFGTANFGFVPKLGSIIQVKYLLTNGTAGNILNPVANDWTFVDDVKDMSGNIIDMKKLFDVTTYVDVNFSSDGETKDFTKAVIPYVSRNFVLATPEQFIYHLKRLNMFSKINAFNKLDDDNFGITMDDIKNSISTIKNHINTSVNSLAKNIPISNKQMQNSLNELLNLLNQYETLLNDNEIYLYIIPDVSRQFTNSTNYFNVAYDAFYLSDEEKSRVLNYLKSQGIMSITTQVKVIQPEIIRYAVFIYVRRFEDALEDNINQQIMDQLSQYFVSNERYDRIIKSDIVKLLKGIEGIDSVDIHFISKANEDYHKEINQGKNIFDATIVKAIIPSNSGTLKAITPVKNKANTLELNTDLLTSTGIPIYTQPVVSAIGTTNITATPNFYDPNKLIGIDPVLGDIVLEKNQYALVRGGWWDRNGVYFSDDIGSNSLKSVNIVYNGVTPK
jgi:hypothetical protein